MTLIDLVNEAEQVLAQAGVASPRLDAEVLLAHRMSIQRVDLYLNRTMEPGDDIAERFRDDIVRRAAGCPVAFITGVREFWSMPIRVTPDVLIPRPETELVVERALEVMTDHLHAIEILDLCTGSGCIAAALARELPRALITLADLSEKALAIARENLAFAADRTKLHCGDLFGALPAGSSFDLIVSNPPYIPEGHRRMLAREITEHEPHMALFAGMSGLDFAGRIIEDAPLFLKPRGWLVMEMGLGQADKLEAMAREFGGWDDVVISKDLAGIERVISLWKN